MNLIAGTTTTKGLTVQATLDLRAFPVGAKVTDEDLAKVNLEKAAVHGEWNYTSKPDMALWMSGHPAASLILHRMASRRPISQMPPLGSALVDAEAVALFRAWIREDLAPPSGTGPAGSSMK